MFLALNILAFLPLLAVSRAAAVEKLVVRDACTSDPGISDLPGVSNVQSFCTSYLGITTSTSTSTVTTTPSTSTVIVSTTSVYTASDTTTAIITSTDTLTPTVTSTSTSFCTVSPSSCTTTSTSVTPTPAVQEYQERDDSYNYGLSFRSVKSSGGSVCGLTGKLNAIALLNVVSKQSLNECQSLCASEDKCSSFGYLPGAKLCSLFRTSISAQGFESQSRWSDSHLTCWDRSCFDAVALSVSISVQATVTPQPPIDPFISTICSCAGVTTPVTTTTATRTAPQPLTTSTQTSTSTSTIYVSTVSTTTTTTATAATTTVVQTTTIPNTYNGTYTDAYGDVYGEFYYTDFYGGDLMSGTCYDEGPGFNVNGTLVPCANFDGCQYVCSYANRNGYSCAGVSYHPNPQPHGYSTCYLKSSVPQGDPYCGEQSGCEEVDSAILFSQAAPS